MDKVKGLLCLGTVCCIFLLSSCASTSMFNSYSNQINPHIANMENGNFSTPLTELAKTAEGSNDAVLYHMERGRIAQIGDETTESKTSFDAAVECFQASEERAVISASQGASQGASLLTNDAAIPYDARGYEKVFTYQEQALNFIFEKDLEKALPAANRASLEQSILLEKHDKELAKTQEQLSEKNVSADDIYAQNYAGINEIEGKVKNSFMNAYADYTCGLINEIYNLENPGSSSEENKALIFYKKALEIYPENRFLQMDAIRVAKSFGMEDDFQAFSIRFPETVEKFKTAKPDGCDVVVFYEDGLVPQMTDIKIPIPTPNGVLSANFPIYQIDAEEICPLEILCNDTVIGSTEVVCDVRALAVKNLKERFPGIVLREVLRTAIAAEGQHQLKKEMGTGGAILGSVLDAIVSRADVRAWYTLPRYVQCMRFTAPHGVTKLVMRSSNLIETPTLELDTSSSKLVVVRIARVGGKCFVKHVAF